MGFEFSMVLSSEELSGDAGDFPGVSACFEQTTPVAVYSVADSPTRKTYAFEVPFRSKWPEDFVLLVDKHAWYLCFHSATDSQQQAVLKTLAQCLHTLGATGTFEEL